MPSSATKYNSEQNLFLLETFQTYLTMSLLYEKILKCYPAKPILFYCLTNNISETQQKSQFILVLQCKIIQGSTTGFPVPGGKHWFVTSKVTKR